MRLIKQTILVFQEGRSDKVYEIDLCEVGQDRYVVNFRYGRRGTNLKEGAKTTTGVSLTDAEKVFANLVAEKTKKGYRDASSPTAGRPGVKRPQVVKIIDDEARKQVVLKRFADEKPASIFKKKETWPLDRAIWRAGELKIKEAAPFLLKFIGSGKPLRDYCVCWALGFCGDEQAIPALTKLYQLRATPDMVRRIAGEALLKLADGKAKAEFRDDLINRLPEELSYLARKGSAEEFEKALNEYLQTDEPSRFAVLEKLYLIDNENTRPALLTTLRNAPMKPNYFKQIRHIFKAAEYRRDAEVFGIIAYRFEKSRAMFSTYQGLEKDSKYPTWIYTGGGYMTENYIQDGRKEIQSQTSRIGYSSRTRTYLRNRVWRTLRRLGEIGDLDYVKMAVGVLLPFSDADAQPVKESHVYDLGKRDYVKCYWDAFAGYWALNNLLYKNSTRYYLKRNSLAWRCKSPYKPGNPAPARREEAFPQLWEQKPEGLLHLLAESNCKAVIEFAAKALNVCEEFCAALDVYTIAMILERPYEACARVGFRLAEARYKPASPDRVLVLAVANCALDIARAEAHRWIQEGREYFIKDSDFITALVFSDRTDTRAFARNLLLSYAFSDANASALATKLIRELLRLDTSKTEVALDVTETILKSFLPQLRSLEMEVISVLLAHPLFEVQELGGNILLHHDTKASDLPESVINSLIASPFAPLRAIGIKLFGKFDDETLLKCDSVMATFAMHELEDIRNAIRPVIHRLCLPPVQPDPRNDQIPAQTIVDRLTPVQREEFSLKLSAHFLQALSEKEPHDGVHSTLVKILREDVGLHWMKQATRGTAWKLIQAKSQAAQELGGLLIEYKVNTEALFAESFDFNELAELSNHEVLAVRQASWMMFSKMIHHLQHAMNPHQHLEEMAMAVKLLDSKWDDSRDFWFDIFAVHFTAKDFTPGILVSVCDSVRPAVQAFGRKLITRFFADEDGQEYLLKLSEHPSADLQTFATNYLERYAANHPLRLRALKHYFISVLSRVNRARIAKSRVIAFLTDEAQKSEEAARIVAEIFARQSVTMAIGDKAAALEAMLKIHSAFPQIPLPIKVQPSEVRNAF
jgi:predicted DNA-binding WGR domain protein